MTGIIVELKIKEDNVYPQENHNVEISRWIKDPWYFEQLDDKIIDEAFDDIKRRLKYALNARYPNPNKKLDDNGAY